MIVLGTYLGLAVALFVGFLWVKCVRWQRRFNGFMAHSILLLLLLGFIVLSTLAESATLSNESLEHNLSYHPSIAHTIDELRPFIIARNNSMMISSSEAIFVFAALIGALALAKSKRLQP